MSVIPTDFSSTSSNLPINSSEYQQSIANQVHQEEKERAERDGLVEKCLRKISLIGCDNHQCDGKNTSCKGYVPHYFTTQSYHPMKS
jgi:hypothetical protein